MLFWIIIIGCTIGGTFIGYSLDKDTENELFSTIFGFCVGGSLGIVVSIFICAIGAQFSYTEYKNEPDPKAKILNLDDKYTEEFNANGTFILAVGGFNAHQSTILSYTFYQRAQDGTYFLHTIKPDQDTLIRIKFIGDNDTPYAQRFPINKKYSTPSWLSPFDLKIDDPPKEKWVIGVPRGTIVNKFTIDNK